MRNRFARVASRQKGKAEQLMSWSRGWAQLHSTFQRRNGLRIVALVHVCVAKPQEGDAGGRCELCCLAKLCDRAVEIALLLHIHAGLQLRESFRRYRRFRRRRLHKQTDPEQVENHGYCDSSRTMN